MWGCTVVNWVNKISILGTVAIASTIASTITSMAIAQPASARFVIFVASNDAATLQKVRTVSPGAFATKINNQPAIQAGIFNSETSADSLAIALQQSGLSAQKYFRASEGKESNVPVPFSEATTNSNLASPQQVVIQPESQGVAYANNQCLQAGQVNGQSSCAQPQYQPQYQQITTNTVIPQVQTQQVLVPRWQQMLVPETRQVVTQAVVPQIVQTGYVQPQSGFIQSSSAIQVPTAYDNNYSNSSIQTASTGLSNEQLLLQQSQNFSFRYVAAVPTNANNQFLLSRVRQYVPSAFLSNSGRGTYIHAGAYQNRDSAESVSRYLRSQGVDSRVLYF